MKKFTLTLLGTLATTTLLPTAQADNSIITCNGSIERKILHNTDIVVNGGTCTISNSTISDGDIKLEKGAKLVLIRSIVSGDVEAEKGGNNITIQNSTIRGKVSLFGGSDSLIERSIIHDVEFKNNTGSMKMLNSSITEKLECNSNSWSFVEERNIIRNRNGNCGKSTNLR